MTEKIGISDSSYHTAIGNDLKKRVKSHWIKVVLYLCGIYAPPEVPLFHFAEDLHKTSENDEMALEEMKIFEGLSALFRASIRSEDGRFAIQLCRHPLVFILRHSKEETRAKSWDFVAFSKMNETSSKLERCGKESIPKAIKQNLRDAMVNCVLAAKGQASAAAKGQSGLQSSTSSKSCCQASINEYIALATRLLIKPSDNLHDKGRTIDPSFNPVKEILRLAPGLKKVIKRNNKKISGFLQR